MLRCIVVDDEPPAIDIIAGYVPDVSFLQLAGTFTNPVEALMQVQKEKIDLIFLDIQMSKLTGLQFMNLLQGRSQVVIVSAYNEYAIHGYEHNITDYLLKPVSFERFYKAAEKALRFADISSRETLPQATVDFIFVKSGNRMVKVNLADILYIEGLKNYISIYLADKRRVITLQNMKTLEDLLPSHRFFRVQKSYIVNIEKIDAIERQRIFINDQVVPVGEAYSSGFFAAIQSLGK